jgi:hypothetical protein
LLNTYTTHLEQLGKSSARDVKSILRKYVFNANAALVVRKAAEFSVDDFVGLIGAVVDKGKGRTAGKVRSFLRAAYALAIRSKMDPALPQAMRSFGIVVNPLASTAALSQFNGTRKRHLNALELGEFLMDESATDIPREWLSRINGLPKSKFCSFLSHRASN